MPMLYKRHQYEASLEQIDKLLTIEYVGFSRLKVANLVELNTRTGNSDLRKIIEDCLTTVRLI